MHGSEDRLEDSINVPVLIRRSPMSRPRPQLSVAIAARNHARWLPRCLDSVLNSVQRSGALVEIVVADDCSTDGTAAVLESYAHRHPGIVVVVRAATCDGVPAIKNLAMRRSSGALVALHDADDEFAPDKVARCLDAYAARPGADLLTHDFTFVDANGQRSISTDDWFGSWRPNGVWVFPRGRVGFNEQMVCGYEELEWSRRHWRSLTRIHLPEPLAIIHGQPSTDRWKVDRERAGLESVTRWRADAGGPKVHACRSCGRQYFQARTCCRRTTALVPLVHLMAVDGTALTGRPATSVVVFTRDRIAATRRAVELLRRALKPSEVEWIFVHAHARPAMLRYLSTFSATARTRAIFLPADYPFIWSHDANRAARAARGARLLLCDAAGGATHAAALRDIHGTVGCRPCDRHAGLSLRRDVFWALGGFDEGCEDTRAAWRAFIGRARNLSASGSGGAHPTSRGGSRETTRCRS
jgi:hypothetical protein